MWYWGEMDTEMVSYTAVNKRNRGVMEINYFLPSNLLHHYDTNVSIRPQGSFTLMRAPSNHVGLALPFSQLKHTQTHSEENPAVEALAACSQWDVVKFIHLPSTTALIGHLALQGQRKNSIQNVFLFLILLHAVNWSDVHVTFTVYSYFFSFSFCF